MSETNVQRNYKDTLFRMVFKEKKNLLSLYNALNKTAYTNVDDLEITTLDNAIYMNYKNDISFVFDFELMLYEHQSTYNPNMPLRDLLYVSRLLQNRIRDEDLYSKKLVKIPAPKFVVFYNGTDLKPEQQTLRLSDAYEKQQEQPALELTVIVYNINLGHNQTLLETCQLLKQYAQYVEQVRKFAKKLPLSEAIKQAVDHCIRYGILSEFLSANRAEAIVMSIFEYDEAKHLKNVREEGREEGESRVIELVQHLTADEKTEALKRVLDDRAYREQLYREYGL